MWCRPDLTRGTQATVTTAGSPSTPRFARLWLPASSLSSIFTSARVGTRGDLSPEMPPRMSSDLGCPCRLRDRGRQAVSGWLPWVAARPLLAGLERAEPEHRAHAAGGGWRARVARHLSGHGQRSCQERPRRAQRQCRRRRWARAVRGRHQRPVWRPRRGPDPDSSDGLHASLPLHVVRFQARTDVRREGRVRCVGTHPYTYGGPRTRRTIPTTSPWATSAR